MPFDASTIAPSARERLIKIGRAFGSGDTLRQSDSTLIALSRHGPALAAAGFGEQQTAYLMDVRDALLAAGVSRVEVRTDRKVTNTALLDGMFAAKGARFTAHSALNGARFNLSLAGQDDAVRSVDAVLNATARAGADPEALRTQLVQLRNVLQNPAVRGAVLDVESIEALLSSRADALDVGRAASAGPRGTPVETDHIDLLDGLIVELVRAARRAARAAARELGQPALVREFALRELYKSTRRRAPDVDPIEPAAV